ncbi:hypothetical protein Ahy_A07g037363 isoform B [Arachis hypogaea]|uniref:Pentatricopeptide repeat-containing protein n=1 Tax=Arachis hypogaea TaxID=3818 RepID=A0A445CIJ6_ARAHY|nr:hypothetical protein Ahy_A07g037363 isoform B [Arachis hypogaea]
MPQQLCLNLPRFSQLFQIPVIKFPLFILSSVAAMLSGSLATTRKISTWPPFSRRIKQTENEIVQMFRLPNSREEKLSFPMEGGCDSRNGHNARILDERFIRILKIFKWGPDAEKALEVLKMKVNARLVREVLKVDVEVNVKIQFFKWAGKRRNFEHDSTTYMALIRCLDEHGFTGELWKTIQDMIKSSCPIGPADLSEIVKILGKAKMVNKALSVFYHENGLQPTEKIYTTLMGIYFKSGKVDEALGLVLEMRTQRCSPTVFTYTELIRGLGKSGRVDDAYSVYKNMLKDSCRPDVVLMNNLINILGRSNRLKDAIKLFEDMKLLDCTPNVVTYNTIIKSLFDARAPPSEASLWLERMKKEGVVPSSFTYSILIDGFCKTNQLEKALLLLEEMDEKGFPPCPAAYCSLINSLGKAKRYEAANELFQELKENCGRSSARVYAVMIKHFGKCGRLNEAINLFNEMKKLGCAPDVYAYNALMSGMVRVDMMDEALSLFRAMEEHGCTPDVNSHNIILNGLARTGGPKRAMEMLNKMKASATNKPDAVSYNTVLGCLSRAEEQKRRRKEKDPFVF